MALEVTGKVIAILPEQTGSGKNGTWVRQDFVIETEDQYPKKICFSAWGDKAQQVKGLKQNQQVKVAFNAESREFNGKWYTDLRIWKLETGASSNQQFNNGGDQFPDYSKEILSGEHDDGPEGDLPF